jgi:hypothetical protein
MDDFVVVASLLKLSYAALALGAVTLFLRYLDKRGGVDFHDFFEDLKNDPKAAALYLGARFVGACLLVGYVLS